MSSITGFAASHPKLVSKVVSGAFVLGVISLVIKVLDDRLSQEKKERFDSWIKGLAPGFRSLDFDSIFLWAIEHPRAYLLIYLVTVESFVVGLQLVAVHTIRIVPILVAAAVAGFGLFLCRNAEPGNLGINKRMLKRLVIRLFLLWGLPCGLFYAAIGVLMGDVRREPNTWISLVIDSCGIALVIPLFLLLYFAILIGPIVLFRLSLGPLAVIGRGVYWLSTSPKGAWAGLIWALTLALGILRLFM
jgi:hypothetical protein